MTDTILEDTIILELKPVRDPLAQHGFPAREPTQRLKFALKRLLRDHGFRCLRVMNGRSPGTPCPKCSKLLDDLGRCWDCFDWLCVCGALTGSALISTCLPCQVEEARTECER